jgi:hypothetical protein
MTEIGGGFCGTECVRYLEEIENYRDYIDALRGE